jgi:hypothetical protein
MSIIDGLELEEIQDRAKRTDELEHTFAMRWKADMKAIERWQNATGKDLVWPDHADLCVWLLEQRDELLGALSRLTTACATNAEVMNAISLADYEYAIGIEERATAGENP